MEYIYVKQIMLHKPNMLQAKSYSSLVTASAKLSKDDGDPLTDATFYRSLVGALQYLTMTRPDIAYAVNQVCQFMHKPRQSHLIAAKRILRYIKATPDFGLRLVKTRNEHLYGFSDADWAGCLDDRRSTTGLCIYFGPNLLTWASKKQPTVSRSSAEAEYRALAYTTADIQWFLFLLRELGIFLRQPPLLHCDNVSATYLASNPVLHARTKHIEVDYHFLRERVLRGDLKIVFVSSTDQTTDIFTKGLSSVRFKFLRDKLMVFPCSPINLKGSVKQSRSQI